MSVSHVGRDWHELRTMGDRTFNDAARKIAMVTALALFVTFLNAIKPLHVDDPYFHYYAAQIAKHPLDPLGFQIFWWGRPNAANQQLAPPVFPYWWAIGIHLLGNHEVLWKCWLVGFIWLFVYAVNELLRRFAGPLAPILLVMTVLSPVFLPSVNLMVDVPALALGLAAIVGFMAAMDRDASWSIIGVGVLAGLAMLTKYTAFVVPGVFLAYGLVSGKPRQALKSLTAAMTAAAVFAAWEMVVVCLYGESNFLCNLRQQDSSPNKYLNLAVPLLTVMGGVAPALWLLSWAALGISRRIIVAGIVGVIVAFVAIVAVPMHYAQVTHHLTVTHVMLGALGSLLIGTGPIVGLRLVRPNGQWLAPAGSSDWFLILWFILELGSYFVLSPFLAVRRVMGMYLVGTLIAGRLAARMCGEPSRLRLIRVIAAVGILVGFFYYGIDLREAQIQRRTALKLAHWANREAKATTPWYFGLWGMQYYLDQGGLQPVLPEQTTLRAGDCFAVGPGFWSGNLRLDDAPIELIDQIDLKGGIPVRTFPVYYNGRLPLYHQGGPWFHVSLYRVCADFTPHLEDAR
jgi:hypothetical protein